MSAVPAQKQLAAPHLDEASAANGECHPVADGFHGTLRAYQRDGLAWLDGLEEAGVGGVLADDMGLGKTVQILAHLQGMKERGTLAAPALIVVPTTLIHNWCDEARKFVPSLRLVIYAGPGTKRWKQLKHIDQADLVVSTYAIVKNERIELSKHPFSVVVADEAQAIKNPSSKGHVALRKLKSLRFIAVTGTPIENRLMDLWALMDLAVPRLLSDRSTFQRIIATPIEQNEDRRKADWLAARVAPYLMRRRKGDVAKDLPPKTETVLRLDMGEAQRGLYESVRRTQYQRVNREIARYGIAQSGIVILDALLKLRQICCDPGLTKLPEAAGVETSVKRDALMELLEALIGEGRRVLVYSSFVTMLQILGRDLEAKGIAYHLLHGGTRDRGKVVRAFREDDAPVFLLSLKAGGTGLNLVEADAVVIYDPWWNPQAENQATDRAHRIGQTKPVFVYRLACDETVETRILDMQKHKAALATAILDQEAGSTMGKLTPEDIERLFGPQG